MEVGSKIKVGMVMRDASRHYVVFYLFLFKERDKSGSGYINYEQLEEIYRVYQVCWTIFLFVFFLPETEVGPLRLI